MRTVIVLVVMAVVLFGVAWSASSFLATYLDDKNKPHANASTAAGDTGKELPPLTHNSEPASRSRTGSNPDAEQLVSELAKVRERQESVARQEQQLTARRRALEIIKEDIRSERDEIDRVRQEVSEQLKGAGDEMSALERKKLETDELIKGAKRGVYEADKVRSGGAKRVGGIFDTAEPADVASMFERMVESGDMMTAAQILSNMKDRRAAAVLSAFQDKAMAAQLAEKMVGLKQAAAAGTSPVSTPGAKPANGTDATN